MQGQNTCAINLCNCEAPSSTSKPSIGSVSSELGRLERVLRSKRGQNVMKVVCMSQAQVSEEHYAKVVRGLRSPVHIPSTTHVKTHTGVSSEVTRFGGIRI